MDGKLLQFPGSQVIEVPDQTAATYPVAELFGDIVGYDDLKAQMRPTLSPAGPRIHWLLCGAPGTAKSMFLLDVIKLPGARYFIGSGTSKAGLGETLIENAPLFVCIDEIEKMSRENMTILLSLMETGWVRLDKHNQHFSAHLPNTRVIAAANKTDRIAPELLSRFLRVTIAPYERGDYIKVVVKVLVNEGIEQSVAQSVAARLWNAGITDVRQARNVARLAAGDKDRIQPTIQFVMKYQ